MKYSQVNWLEWPEAPSEQVFNDWVTARKSNKHPALTQTAMTSYSKHVARLVQDGQCSVETAFMHAAEGGWRAIFYKYVVSAISRDMDGFAMNVSTPTRQVSIDRELLDTSWVQKNDTYSS